MKVERLIRRLTMGNRSNSVSAKRLRWLNRFGPLLALMLVYGFFALLNARIATLVALETIIQQSVIVGVAALGMTMVIISAGIDLSAGSIIAMSSVVVALLIQSLGLSPLLAVLGCLFVATPRWDSSTARSSPASGWCPLLRPWVCCWRCGGLPRDWLEACR